MQSVYLQESKKEKSNRRRKEATRQALLDAGRALFIEKGFAQTGTPEIVANAGVTRGALYHHFGDKLGLFRAVIESEADAVAACIAEDSTLVTPDSETPLEEMLRGADAYFDAMSVAGRAKLLLLEGPTTLGVPTMEEIDRGSGQSELREGLARLLGEDQRSFPLDALAAALSAAYDKAAGAIALGESIDDHRRALRLLVEGLSDIR